MSGTYTRSRRKVVLCKMRGFMDISINEFGREKFLHVKVWMG